MLLAIGDLQEEILVQLRVDPVRGSDTPVRSARVRGGSAANVAAIDAETGGTPRFVGQVGDDALGHILGNDLDARGVDALVRYQGGTGVVVTTVGKGGRSRLVDRGASQRLSVIDPSVLSDVTQVYFAASAFGDDPLASAVDRLLAEIRDQRLAVVIGGPGSTDLEKIGRGPYLELIAAIAPDAVVLNRIEHHSLGLDMGTCIEGADNTIITAGAQPTMVIAADRPAEEVAVPPVDRIRDRTGVGDGFLAGFMASRRTGADAVAASHAGHRVAAKVLAQVGPTTGT